MLEQKCVPVIMIINISGIQCSLLHNKIQLLKNELFVEKSVNFTFAEFRIDKKHKNNLSFEYDWLLENLSILATG